MTRALLFFVFALFAAAYSVPATAEDKPTNCELHIWPTDEIFAVYHGASVGWNGYGAYVKDMTLSPMEKVAKRLGESIDPVAQKNVIKQLNLDSDPRFYGYDLIFHNAPAEPKHGNWIAKDVGKGERDADSQSLCYSELHVVFITLLRTAISKKIQTGFLFREFGEKHEMTYKAVDAGSTGAPDFKTNADEKSEKAKSSVRAAFQENLNIFLRKKKMRNLEKKRVAMRR